MYWIPGIAGGPSFLATKGEGRSSLDVSLFDLRQRRDKRGDI